MISCSMKQVALRLEEILIKECEKIARGLDVSRNRYMADAIEFYNQHHREQQIKAEVAAESAEVAEASMAILSEFEDMELY